VILSAPRSTRRLGQLLPLDTQVPEELRRRSDRSIQKLIPDGQTGVAFALHADHLAILKEPPASEATHPLSLWEHGSRSFIDLY
jgi:hypothetical protein